MEPPEAASQLGLRLTGVSHRSHTQTCRPSLVYYVGCLQIARRVRLVPVLAHDHDPGYQAASPGGIPGRRVRRLCELAWDISCRSSYRHKQEQGLKHPSFRLHRPMIMQMLTEVEQIEPEESKGLDFTAENIDTVLDEIR